MNFLVDRAFDQATDYLSEHTEATNMPSVNRLLNEARDKYEDGELNSAAAEDLVARLLPLVKPEARADIESMFNNNRSLIARYLSK